uniref:KAT8 regulatory NSL complex subunit 2 n=1 Tax=Ciona savignyi TaxID=51511 RepID=H2YWI2_CIOSA
METNFRRKPVCRHKICKRARYRSFKYCYQHILNDPTAPFSTCQYVSNITKRKCPNPALISDRINSTVPCLCEIHNNAKSGRLKYRSHRKKYAKLAEREQHATLFQKLGKYRKGSGTSEDTRHHCDEDNAPSYDNALGILEQDIHENRQWVTGLSSSWKSGEADIDVDLVEDLDNPLKYAGVYTAEEVISMSKQRLVRLQSLYIDQFKHLHGTLLERRRKYLVDKAMEEQQGSSTSNAQLSRSDQHHLQDLKSLVNFRRKSGPDLLLHKKLKRRRLEATKGETIMQME